MYDEKVGDLLSESVATLVSPSACAGRRHALSACAFGMRLHIVVQPVARTRFDSLEAREETVKEINSFYDKARTALAPSASAVGDRRPTSDR